MAVTRLLLLAGLSSDFIISLQRAVVSCPVQPVRAWLSSPLGGRACGKSGRIFCQQVCVSRMTNAAVLAHAPRRDESTASTILSPRQETKQTELNCATNTGVGGAILSGFALDQIDWMAKPDDPGSYGAAIAFFVSAELSLLSAIASASIYRRLNSLSSSAVEEFVEQHAWLLNGPWWLFLAGGTSFLVGMASSAFMNDTDLGLRCIGAVTAGITTCGLMCFAHASSDSGMLGTIRRPPRRGDAPLSPIQRVVSSPSHG